MSGFKVNQQQLTGRAGEHLVPFEREVFLHAGVVAPFKALQTAALQEGIRLSIASGFRSFDRQLAIWNAKASGARTVLDSHSLPLDIEGLSDVELLFAILRWSALPGTSRHHWGTDMDVWDTAAAGKDYDLQLVPSEYESGGPFSALGRWLQSPALLDYGFERPYAIDSGGVSPEPWHLSYKPVAEGFEQLLTPEVIVPVIEGADILLKGVILDNIDEIFHRFVVPGSRTTANR